MANRGQREQSAHDTRVQSHANQLESLGWNVRADLSGWPRPATINGRRPDIIATKSGHTKIVEVETDRGDDKKQHEKFRRHAGQKPNTQFYILFAGPNGGHAGRSG